MGSLISPSAIINVFVSFKFLTVCDRYKNRFSLKSSFPRPIQEKKSRPTISNRQGRYDPPLTRLTHPAFMRISLIQWKKNLNFPSSRISFLQLCDEPVTSFTDGCLIIINTEAMNFKSRKKQCLSLHHSFKFHEAFITILIQEFYVNCP